MKLCFRRARSWKPGAFTASPSSPPACQHHADGRNREFTIAGIERQGEAKSVVLKWDGEALGASTKGERTVEVPARNQFKVTQVQPVQAAGEQYIQV